MSFRKKFGLAFLTTVMLLLAWGMAAGNLEGHIMRLDRIGTLPYEVSRAYSCWLLTLHFLAGAALPWLYEWLSGRLERSLSTFVTASIAVAPLPPICLSLALRYPAAQGLATFWFFTGLIAIALSVLVMTRLTPEQGGPEEEAAFG